MPLLGVIAILAWGGHSGCKDRGDPSRDKYNGSGKQTVAQPQRVVSFDTSDGWKIIADVYIPQDKPIGAAILLHQRGGSAGDWHDLCDALREKGIIALALDQRGCGRSLSPDSKLNGDNAPWDTSNDIAAAIKWLIANYA